VHNRAGWESEAAHLRQRVRENLGLMPWPKRTALNPIVGRRHDGDGYAIESVAFEAIPGFYVTGNLYFPTTGNGPFPLVLSLHGHTKYEWGRCYDQGQYRAGMLARMGAMVLAIDMFGYGESMSHMDHQTAHKNPFSTTIQTWSSIRALDLLCSLDKADTSRIAATGSSGGGTQTFLLAAFDERVTVSVPTVMVSSYFFGGCPCESGLPIHVGKDHFTTNVGIAALAVPRPQLLISDGKDWTDRNPTSELPFLKTIYSWYDSAPLVENAHFVNEGHDYGPSKRTAMYHFMAKHLGLDLSKAINQQGVLDETMIRVLPVEDLHVFTPSNPPPANQLPDVAAVAAALRLLQQE
jgi:hypothetical protein